MVLVCHMWLIILNGVALQCNKENNDALFTITHSYSGVTTVGLLSLLQPVRSQEVKTLSVTRSLLLLFNYLQVGGLAHLPAQAPVVVTGERSLQRAIPPRYFPWLTLKQT